LLAFIFWNPDFSMNYGRFKQKTFAASKASRNLREIISFHFQLPSHQASSGRGPAIGGKKDDSTEFWETKAFVSESFAEVESFDSLRRGQRG
jgi:hypothetical protein